ncbi:transposase family protein [Candidatus Poribacteria bacterium]|nr:transposase family protein [Candidatus Poribacteria bacterium]
MSLSDTTIWRILTEAQSPLLPPQIPYILTHPFQIWFVGHMHLRTLKNGEKVYSLIVLDGWSRVRVSDEIVLSKGARDACLILLSAFAKWGMPEQILSDNAKAFASMLYRLLLGVLRVKVRYITPGCPWESLEKLWAVLSQRTSNWGSCDRQAIYPNRRWSRPNLDKTLPTVRLS